MVDFLFSSTGLVTLAALIAGFVCTWYSFKIRIEVSPGDLAVRDDPLTSAFTLTNSGWLPIYHVQWQTNIIDLQYLDTGFHEEENAYISPNIIPKLSPGRKTYIGLPQHHLGLGTGNAKVATMEVVSVVRYKNVFSLEGQESFRFVCFLTPDREYRWEPYEGQTTFKKQTN